MLRNILRMRRGAIDESSVTGRLTYQPLPTEVPVPGPHTPSVSAVKQSAAGGRLLPINDRAALAAQLTLAVLLTRPPSSPLAHLL
jgi:hypothetical protein